MVEGKEAARDSALGLSLVIETPQGVTQELTAGVWINLWIKSTIKGEKCLIKDFWALVLSNSLYF